MKSSKTVITANDKKTSANKKFKTVDEYLSSLPANIRTVAKEMRKTIRQVIPQADEVISYNIPAFKIQGKLVIWFAAWKEHTSVYPRTALLEAAIKEISGYEGGKGTIKFPTDRPLPVGLIKRIIKFRLQENLRKTKSA